MLHSWGRRMPMVSIPRAPEILGGGGGRGEWTGPPLTTGECDTALKDSLGHRLLIPPLHPLRIPQARRAPQQALRTPPQASPAVPCNFFHMRGRSSIRERGNGLES